MSSEENNSTFQTCIWYGIHYPYELTPNVVEALNKGAPHHVELATNRECKINEHIYYRNSNSDFDPSHGCLFAPHMALTGDEFDSAQYCTLDFAVTDLNDIEDQNQACMDELDDMWQLLRKNMKPVDIAQMQIGWSVYICEHASDSDSDQE